MSEAPFPVRSAKSRKGSKSWHLRNLREEYQNKRSAERILMWVQALIVVFLAVVSVLIVFSQPAERAVELQGLVQAFFGLGTSGGVIVALGRLRRRFYAEIRQLDERIERLERASLPDAASPTEGVNPVTPDGSDEGGEAT